MRFKPFFVADDKIPFLKESPLRDYAEIRFLPGAKIRKEDLLGADALITRTRTRCDRLLLEGTPVKLIATATIGYDHIDTGYCAKAGIRWINAPGCNAESVAQYLTSLLVTDAERNRIELRKKTIGIVGVGNVGKRVGRIAQALGMNVLKCDPPRAEQEQSDEFVDFETIKANADYMTFHVPLIRNGKYPTLHMADKAFFQSLGKKLFLINTSRGEVVDNPELKEALNAGQIRGAALDVWEREPEPDRELMDALDFATPHIAGYSTDGKANGTAMCIRAIAEFFGFDALKHYSPDKVPPPENEWIDWTSLYETIRQSYDILEDDAALRKSPELFEKLRGNYRLRREFQAFTVRNPPREMRKTLDELGFKRTEPTGQGSVID